LIFGKLIPCEPFSKFDVPQTTGSVEFDKALAASPRTPMNREQEGARRAQEKMKSDLVGWPFCENEEAGSVAEVYLLETLENP